MNFTPLPELLKGLTDIPLVLLAALLALRLRRAGRRDWAEVYALAAISALLGTALHCLVIPVWPLRLAWVALYALLFALVRRFALRFVGFVCGGQAEERRAVWLAEGALLACAVGFDLAGHPADIYFLAGFAALLVVRLLVCLLRHPAALRRCRALALAIADALVCQLGKEAIPHGVALTHFALLAALWLLFRLLGESFSEPLDIACERAYDKEKT